MAIKEHAAAVDATRLRQGTTLNYGSVEGQLVELDDADGNDVDVVIEDRAFGAHVTSRLSGEWVQVARDAHGGRVYAEGRVLRDAERGRPIRIDEVTSLRPLPPVADGALLSVAGNWEAPPGYEIVTARADNFADPTEDA